MSFYGDLREYLATDATLQSVVTRIYYYRAPQGTTLPFVALKPDSESRSYHSGGSDGLKSLRIPIDIVATTFEQADIIKEAIRDRLDTYIGAMGGSQVQSCFMSDVFFTDELPTQGNERGDITCRATFSITVEETKPSVRV